MAAPACAGGSPVKNDLPKKSFEFVASKLADFRCQGDVCHFYHKKCLGNWNSFVIIVLQRVVGQLSVG